MYLSMSRIVVMSLLVFLLSGCDALEQIAAARSKQNTPLPEHSLYILAVSVNRYNENELVIVDTETWQVARRTPLLAADPWDFSRDPQGRIWIGYGAAPGPETRVQVLTPAGRLLKTLSACLTPYLPIHFAAGRAFISCLQNGFYATVLVVDLSSLEVVQQVDIRLQDEPFLLLTTGGDENYFVLVGNGQNAKRIILLDTHTLTTLGPFPAPDSNAMDVLAYQGRFILLNSVAESLLRNKMVEPLAEGRPDFLIVNPKPAPAFSIYEMVAPGALWGTIKGDMLFSYHDAELLGFNPDPFRAVSRLNLVTHEANLWPLPDGWNARELTVVNGEILLAHSIFSEPETAGLYRFDPPTGKLTMLINIPGAQRILAPPSE